MKAKLIGRCLIGAPIGLTISTLITIVISLTVGDGKFYPVVPELISECGSEIHAVLLQTGCSLLYGAAWAGASLVWEKEGWSLLRQTFTHLGVCSLATFPIAYYMQWMKHTVPGILSYFGIFMGIYVCIWFSQYGSMKRKICQMNGKLQEQHMINGQK